MLSKKTIPFFFSLLVFNITSTWAETPENLLKKLPREFSGFSISGKVHVFEERRWGASSSYLKYLDGDKDNTIQLTIILFDYGVKNIKPGIKSKVVNTSFHSALKDIRELEKRRYYKGVRVLRTSKKQYQSPEMKLKTRFAELQYSIVDNVGKTLAVQSFLVVTGVKKHVLKLRFTTAQSNKNIDKHVHQASSKIITHLLK